jgi:hypothetical protein
MDDIELIKEDIQQLKTRNARVEADKAWETSHFRKVSIAILTYAAVVAFFFAAHLPKPFINALVPTAGFILSTLSLPAIKAYWISRHERRLE